MIDEIRHDFCIKRERWREAGLFIDSSFGLLLHGKALDRSNNRDTRGSERYTASLYCILSFGAWKRTGSIEPTYIKSLEKISDTVNKQKRFHPILSNYSAGRLNNRSRSLFALFNGIIKDFS